MNKALLPVLLLPVLLMSCNGGPKPLEFTLPDQSYSFSPNTAVYVSLPIIRAASTKQPLPINFSASGYPAGITLAFEKTPLTYTDYVIFKVTVGEVPLGTYTGTITGKSGSMTRTAKVSIVVKPPPVRTAP